MEGEKCFVDWIGRDLSPFVFYLELLLLISENVLPVFDSDLFQ